MEESSNTNNLSIPIAIVIAGALIAGAMYFGGSRSNALSDSSSQAKEEQQSGNLDQMAAVTSDDHIRGNPDAPVVIVEYSDFECPFCQLFHPTMQRVMNEYGTDGRVAWVYRHFPLDQLHPINARKAAVASECAAAQGGDGAFWRFTDEYFARTPANDQAGPALIPEIAKDIGLDTAAFEVCRASGEYDTHVQENFNNAVATGGQGTPWSILVTKNGERYPISGAQPYEAVKQLIDLALENQ